MGAMVFLNIVTACRPQPLWPSAGSATPIA